MDYTVDLLGFSFPWWGQAVLLSPTLNESGIGLKDSDYLQPCPTSPNMMRCSFIQEIQDWRSEMASSQYFKIGHLNAKRLFDLRLKGYCSL